MNKDKTEHLKQLGSYKPYKRYSVPSADILETFDAAESGMIVKLYHTEFASFCPKTGQPDFGRITVIYETLSWCVETKSLKIYLNSFRDTGIFMETAVKTIKDDLVKVLMPKNLLVSGEFNPRGGTILTATAIYRGENSAYFDFMLHRL